MILRPVEVVDPPASTGFRQPSSGSPGRHSSGAAPYSFHDPLLVRSVAARGGTRASGIWGSCSRQQSAVPRVPAPDFVRAQGLQERNGDHARTAAHQHFIHPWWPPRPSRLCVLGLISSCQRDKDRAAGQEPWNRTSSVLVTRPSRRFTRSVDRSALTRHDLPVLLTRLRFGRDEVVVALRAAAEGRQGEKCGGDEGRETGTHDGNLPPSPVGYSTFAGLATAAVANPAKYAGSPRYRRGTRAEMPHVIS